MLLKELHEARRLAGWSQRTLAERVDVDAQTIKRLEKGVGSVGTLIMVMGALDFRLTGLAPVRTLAGQWPLLLPVFSFRWFAVAGLTAGSAQMMESLMTTTKLIREQSLNPDIGIMVGGPVFTANPALAAEVGADAIASNAPAAFLIAQKLIDVVSDRRGICQDADGD